MSRRLRGLALTAGLCAVVVGCAPTPSAGYARSLAAGARALSAGRTREAAERYDEAARASSRPRDREEAEYLAAMALLRAGDRAGALARLDHVVATSPDFERGARAAYDAARVRCDASDLAEQARGDAALLALVGERPATGPARLALTLLLRTRDARDPSRGESVATLESLLAEPAVAATSLYESAQAERAKRLAESGRRAEAVAAWRRLFATVPYPQNSRWDDGHVALARLLREGGDARGAVSALDEMLAVRDPSCSGGSCDAPLFQEGAMLRGEILRDDARDLAAAARAFHATYEMFTTSLVRDDALWAEGEVRERLGDGSACAVWFALAREFPCTRRGRGAAERGRGCNLAPHSPAVACE